MLKSFILSCPNHGLWHVMNEPLSKDKGHLGRRYNIDDQSLGLERSSGAHVIFIWRDSRLFLRPNTILYCVFPTKYFQ
jgi:hypothetical protein